MRRPHRALALAKPRHPFLSPITIFATLVALIALFFAAQARAEPAAKGLMKADDAGTGTLLLRTQELGLYLPAPRVATDFDVTISGMIARTRVTQRFENPSDGWVEGVYVFPLSENSAVDTLRMQIGERFIQGDIKERQEARKIYEAAKAEGKKASLMEQERPNIFTNSVANIGPHETIVVQIEYQEALPLKDGAFSFRLPLVVGPRYNPPMRALLVSAGERLGLQVSDPVPDRERIDAPVLRPEFGKINPVTLSVHIESGFPLGTIASANHAIKTEKKGDDSATITLADANVPADRDFVLTYAPKPGTKPYAALLKERVKGQDYVLALVVPPSGDRAPAVAPREIIFVLDNSGSMAGTSMRDAKAALLLALGQLSPQDRFNVIRFDDTYDVLFNGAVDATEANVAHAKQFVQRLEANGGTEMLPALTAALKDPTPEDATRLRQVVFLTDGSVGNEDQLFAEIQRNLGRSRLFTVGIGSAPNSYFMAGAARFGRGTYTYIGQPEEVTPRMATLFEKLSRPVMTNLHAEFTRGTAVEAFPDPLPDLYAGEPVLITAKKANADGTLKLSGLLEGKAWEESLRLANAEDGKGIARLWARNKIAALEERRIVGESLQTIDAAVLAVALEHNLVSRLTSLVAVDVTPARPVGAELGGGKVPLNLPEGWVFDKVFGEQIETRRASLTSDTATLAMLATGKPAATAPSDPDTGLDLPQGGTESRLALIAGLALLLLGLAMFAETRRRPTTGV